MELNKIFYEEQYDEAFKFAIENNFTIKELESSNGRRTFQIVEIPKPTEEDEIDLLRVRRETECFSIINRGKLWYDKLTEEQIKELDKWYHEWLDVTKTQTIPEKPTWLN